ncbi:uncharacterized protein LOC121973495 [Zingiber officinale]|uniref:uncharacterized protein LOC121973495 n=1 Tax=Zingiber officinale TaxID=94328 RepID=UPI001C4BB05F|nr:uncharacterized protein LOC121973495 [Zingiber officinale]
MAATALRCHLQRRSPVDPRPPLISQLLSSSDLVPRWPMSHRCISAYESLWCVWPACRYYISIDVPLVSLGRLVVCRIQVTLGSRRVDPAPQLTHSSILQGRDDSISSAINSPIHPRVPPGARRPGQSDRWLQVVLTKGHRTTWSTQEIAHHSGHADAGNILDMSFRQFGLLSFPTGTVNFIVLVIYLFYLLVGFVK